MSSAGLDDLVRRSNRLGADLRVTNSGGGNTSVKATETDPLTGRPIEVLWVKGSGGDLRTATAASFAALDLSKVDELKRAYVQNHARGLKSAAGDRLVERYRECGFGDNAIAPSIDTPLHALIPARHVDHTHPNAVIAIAATRRSRELAEEAFGGEVGWVPWMRPGMELALAIEEQVRRQPHIRGVVLAQHGLINWAIDGQACYERTLGLIDRATRFIERHGKGDRTFGGARFESLAEADRRRLLIELLPWLRERVGQPSRRIATVQSDARILLFVNSQDAPRLAAMGTSCPDHFLRTKIRPLYVPWDPQRESEHALREKLDHGLAEYRRNYARYYEARRKPDSPPMRDPNPTVILIPGVGMIAWGRNKSESRVTAECYNCAVEVMRGAEAIDQYVALPEDEAFDIEYWALEEAKLRRMPPEGELAGAIVIVMNVGSPAGEAAAIESCARGAHVVCADPSAEAARAAAEKLTARFGNGIGVAGTGVSACGRAIHATGSEQDLRELARLAYGGVDRVIH